jgi:hypothetical protein
MKHASISIHQSFQQGSNMYVLKTRPEIIERYKGSNMLPSIIPARQQHASISIQQSYKGYL